MNMRERLTQCPARQRSGRDSNPRPHLNNESNTFKATVYLSLESYTEYLHKNNLLYGHSITISRPCLTLTLWAISCTILLHMWLPLLCFYAFMFYGLCHYVLCDKVFILMCVCRILIKGYSLTCGLVLFLSILVIPMCGRQSWPALSSTFGRTRK